MDCGDHVIIINADKVALSGNKAAGEKILLAHWLGLAESRNVHWVKCAKKKPEKFVFNAVKRMMGRRTAVALADKRLTKLHVYAGGEHKHAAQNPQVIDFANMNRKK